MNASPNGSWIHLKFSVAAESPHSLNAEQLARLGDGIAPPPKVRLDDSLPLSADERSMWERKLNRYLKSCGCAEGAVGLFIGMAIVLFAYLALNEPWSHWEITAAVALPLAFFAAGKMLGQRLDRLRFRKECKRMLSRLAVEIVQGGHHG